MCKKGVPEFNRFGNARAPLKLTDESCVRNESAAADVPDSADGRSSQGGSRSVSRGSHQIAEGSMLAAAICVTVESHALANRNRSNQAFFAATSITITDNVAAEIRKLAANGRPAIFTVRIAAHTETAINAANPGYAARAGVTIGAGTLRLQAGCCKAQHQEQTRDCE